MATKTFKVSLSLDNPRIIQTGINVRSFDKQSIKIAIELIKDSQVYQIPTDAQIKISLLKLARQEQKIILDVPFTSTDSIDWIVPEYLDGYQGDVRVGVYLLRGSENIDVGYFNIASKVSDIDKAAEEFTDSVMQGWDQIEVDLAEIRATITQVDTLASDFTADVATKQADVTNKYNAFDTDITEANQTIDDILALQPQFQSVLDETTGKDVISGPEIILARNGEVDLKARLDKEQQQVTAQLAQTGERTREVANRDSNSNTFIAPNTGKKVYMTIIDDDARSQVWDILKPISEEKGVPITLAVPINLSIGTPLTKEQLLYLQNELGWEMSDHSYNHVDMRTLTDEELEHETVDSKLELTSWGLNIKNFVAPYGSNDVPNVRKIASKYYNCGAKVGGGINTRPVKNHELKRVALGTFTDGNDSLDFYKGIVDSAIANNGWLIWMTHVGNATHTEEQTQHLRDVIDYALSKGVEIVNLQDGFEVFGNKVEVEGEYAVTNQGQSFESGKLPLSYDFDKTGDSDIPDFNNNQLSVSLLGPSTQGSAPDRGVIYTFKPSDPKFNLVYSHQFLVGIDRGLYYRDYLANSWRDWMKMYVGNDYEISVTVPTLASMKATTVIGSLPVTTSGKQVIIKPSSIPDEYIWSARPAGTNIRFRLFNTHTASMPEIEIRFLVSVLENNPA